MAYKPRRPGLRSQAPSPPVPLVNVPMLVLQKRRFDAMQAWVSWRLERRVAQWEIMELFFSEDPRARRLLRDARAATTPRVPPRSRPKSKLP